MTDPFAAEAPPKAAQGDAIWRDLLPQQGELHNLGVGPLLKDHPLKGNREMIN